MFAHKDLNLEWLEIAGQARNDGNRRGRNDGGWGQWRRGNDRGQWRQGLRMAGAEPPPYGGVGAALGAALPAVWNYRARHKNLSWQAISV